jgi:hypothetical protein
MSNNYNNNKFSGNRHELIVTGALLLIVTVGLFMALNDWLRRTEYREVYEWEKRREMW